MIHQPPVSEVPTSIKPLEKIAVPTYSQDVNSSQFPLEEEQLPGVFQGMMLNWPTIWNSSEVETRCQQQKENNNERAISCTCTKCGRKVYTKANTDIFSPDSPSWVTGEGWYASCVCGQVDQWTWRQMVKNDDQGTEPY